MSVSKKILIVDDEKDLSNIIKMALEAEGFIVEYCSNGEIALETARAFHPNLILLDLMMPRLSGFDTIELLRTMPETSTAKIVIFSALAQPSEIEKAHSLGANEYIIKSTTPLNEVVGRIKKLFDEPADNDFVSLDGMLHNTTIT